MGTSKHPTENKEQVIDKQYDDEPWLRLTRVVQNLHDYVQKELDWVKSYKQHRGIK